MFECIQIRETLVQNPNQKSKRVGKGEGKRQIYLTKYGAPAEEDIAPKDTKLIALLGIDYTITFEGKFTIPNDHPLHDKIVVNLAMGRVSTDFDMDQLPSLMVMQKHLVSHLINRYDVDVAKVSKALTAHLTVSQVKPPPPTAAPGDSNYRRLESGLADAADMLKAAASNTLALQDGIQAALQLATGNTHKIQRLEGESQQHGCNIQRIDGQLKELHNFRESAQKQLNDLVKNAYNEAAQKIGGRALSFDDEDDKKVSAAPTAKKLDDIANPQDQYLRERFTALIGPNAPVLTEKHAKNIWKPWKKLNNVNTANDLGRPDIRDVLQGTFFEVNNPIDLVSLKSIEELIKQLDRKFGAVAFSSSEDTAPVFLTSDETSLIENSPFLTAQILPAAFGVCHECMITINEDLNVTLSFASACDAARSLSAVLQLACKTKGESTQIEIEGGCSNMNINGKQIDFSFPDMQGADRISFLELNKMILLGHVESIPSFVSTFKLKDCKVPLDSATGLLNAIHVYGGSVNFTLELHSKVNIPDATLLALLGVVSSSQTKFVLSLMDGSWKELPSDVSKAYTNQILTALENIGSELHLSVDEYDLMEDLLQPLVDLLGPTHISSLETIAADACYLPLEGVAEFYDSTKDKIKDWAASAISIIHGRRAGEARATGTGEAEADVTA
jgi:hypothetical protein